VIGREMLIFQGAMGRPDDLMAVIDSKARVIGVQNLRVVDASSFPLLPPGHPTSIICMLPLSSCTHSILYLAKPTNLSTDALAEKIADDIKRSCDVAQLDFW
jgi:hypothetical protein